MHFSTNFFVTNQSTLAHTNFDFIWGCILYYNPPNQTLYILSTQPISAMLNTLLHTDVNNQNAGSESVNKYNKK